MRQKIGTVLDEGILKRAKVRAAQEGKAFNELLEAALQAYLSRHQAISGQRLVEESWGVFRVTPRELRHALKGELFET
ncbi:MAG: hypothetical protein ACREQA_06970 [Candidatus Binatia bacterium]